MYVCMSMSLYVSISMDTTQRPKMKRREDDRDKRRDKISDKRRDEERQRYEVDEDASVKKSQRCWMDLTSWKMRRMRVPVRCHRMNGRFMILP